MLVVNGDVGRCVVTTHDPDTGVPTSTRSAARGYRREGLKEPLPLGVYGSVAVPGRVRVGDRCAAAADAALLSHSTMASTGRWQPHARDTADGRSSGCTSGSPPAIAAGSSPRSPRRSRSGALAIEHVAARAASSSAPPSRRSPARARGRPPRIDTLLRRSPRLSIRARRRPQAVAARVGFRRPGHPHGDARLPRHAACVLRGRVVCANPM